MNSRDPRSAVLRLLLVGVAALVGGSCGNSNLATGPTRGSIEIRTTSDGDDIDRNGYGVAVDQRPPVTIETNGRVVVDDLTLGNHRVSLSELESNCTVDENPQTISVAGADTVTVSFAVTCTLLAAPPPGKGN